MSREVGNGVVPSFDGAPFVHRMLNYISRKVALMDGGTGNCVAKGAAPAIFGIALDQFVRHWFDGPGALIWGPRKRKVD